MAGLPNFYRGDTKSYAVNFKKKGLGIDVSNQVLTLTFKTKKDDADNLAVLTKSMTFPADANSAVGVGTFTLTKDDTDTLVPGMYWYGFQLVNPATSPVTVTTLGSGRVEVLTDITRTTV